MNKLVQDKLSQVKWGMFYDEHHKIIDWSAVILFYIALILIINAVDYI